MKFFFFLLVKISIVFSMMIGIFVASAPRVISSDWGLQQVLKGINFFIPGKLEIHALNVHWGKGQTIEGIILKDPQENSVLEIKRFATEASLWQILKESTHWGLTQIQDLHIAVISDQKNWINLQQALGVPLKPGGDSPSTLMLSNIYADLNLYSNNQPFSLQIRGITQQEDLKGSFDIQGVFKGLLVSQWKDLKEKVRKYFSSSQMQDAKIHIQIANFPIKWIDDFSKIKDSPNLLHSFLGKDLNIIIDKDTEGTLQFATSTPFMQGEIKGKIAKGLFSLQEPSHFYLHLNPEYEHEFSRRSLKFINPTQVSIVWTLFSFPLAFLDPQSCIDCCQLEFKVDLDIPKTAISIAGLGFINLAYFTAHLNAPFSHSNMHLRLLGHLDYDRKPLEINFESILKKPTNLAAFLPTLKILRPITY